MWEKKRKLNKSNSFYQRIKIDLIININYNIKEEFKIKVFTEKDYFRALKLFPQIREIELKEKDNTYGIALTEEEYIKNEHDKLFKKILEIPKEVESVIRKAVDLGQYDKLELESVRNEFVTEDYKGKQVDILYKLKGKEVYFLIEHQSKNDYYMPLRITDYEMQIMKHSFRKRNYKGKLQAKIIAIVIYTGVGRWRVPRSILEIQEQFGYKLKPNQNYLGIGEYNVIDVNNYTKQELLEEGTLLSKALLIEKVRKEGELLDVLDEIIKRTKENEIGIMIGIFRYVLVKDLGKEASEKYIKILKEGGKKDMLESMYALREDRRKTLLKSEKRGEKIGKKLGIIETAQNMFKENIDVDLIEKVTGLSRKEFM